MATARDQPYVWVTWISKLLAGEASCQWAAWFRAHHTYEKRPSDFDVAAWTASHAELVRRHAGELGDQGYRVTVESQNAFRLRGRDGMVLAGRPDLLGVRGDEATVVDCKTGTPRTSDQLQVLVYMIVMPHTHPACRGKTMRGVVRYRADEVAIPPEKVTSELRDLFRSTMHRVGATGQPPRVPSYDECRFCDITGRDCPDRIDSPPGEVAADHDLF